jgi:glycosyltransferase involved in cell wall biosynthesis
MSVGTPVLASNVGAIHEFLTKDVGRLFQPGNINELTESIIDFNINNEEWIQKSKKAKVKINKKFNSMKIASEFRNHIDQKYLEGIK